MKRTLSLPVESMGTSEKSSNYEAHKSSFRTLIGPTGMRVIGRARDLGIIKERKRRG